jgi:hypothetical protein
MRVVKALWASSPTFHNDVAPWQCVEVVKDPSVIPKGEKYIHFKDGAWVVYRKSKVHLATPRYIGRYDNVLSAVHSARIV